MYKREPTLTRDFGGAFSKVTRTRDLFHYCTPPDSEEVYSPLSQTRPSAVDEEGFRDPRLSEREVKLGLTQGPRFGNEVSRIVVLLSPF